MQISSTSCDVASWRSNADDVPGKIRVLSPEPGDSAVVDEQAVLYSQLLWNQLVGCEEYRSSRTSEDVTSSPLDAESTEGRDFYLPANVKGGLSC